MKHIIASLCTATCLAITTHGTAAAQNHRLLQPNIASLQVVAGDNWLSMPVITLNKDEVIHISFDDLTHEYHRYVYSIEHCEADWTPSENLLPSEYCEGFTEGNTIDDVEESINTKQLYTHYHFQLPNRHCRPFLSGNYRVTVTDDNTGDSILTACFMLSEQTMNLGIEAYTNTDKDINRQHQQVAMQLSYNGNKVTDHSREIKTVVLKNGYWYDAAWNATPQFIMPDGLKWSHNTHLIFNAGNEYRKFETLDPTHPTMGIEAVGWDGTHFSASVWPDEPRPNYVYDEDANGSFYIRNSDNIENDIASDYILTRFTLLCTPQPGDVFLHGQWTNSSLAPTYRMTYHPELKAYTADVLLKQGYYSYTYLLRTPDTLRTLPADGNFFQTENTYYAFVYYRPIGSRTDRLVAYQRVQLK